jgi:hypothetical protein
LWQPDKERWRTAAARRMVVAVRTGGGGEKRGSGSGESEAAAVCVTTAIRPVTHGRVTGGSGDGTDVVLRGQVEKQ